MIIDNHIINTKEIIGISPLFVKQDSNDIAFQLYGAHYLRFFIYTKSNSFEISSNLLYTRGELKTYLLSCRQKSLEFKKVYYDTTEKIYHLIEELHPWPPDFYSNKQIVEDDLKAIKNTIQ